MFNDSESIAMINEHIIFMQLKRELKLLKQKQLKCGTKKEFEVKGSAQLYEKEQCKKDLKMLNWPLPRKVKISTTIFLSKYFTGCFMLLFSLMETSSHFFLCIFFWGKLTLFRCMEQYNYVYDARTYNLQPILFHFN